MKTLLLSTLAAITIFGLSTCKRTSTGIPPIPTGPLSAKTMKAFGSEEELKQYLKKLAEKQIHAYGGSKADFAINTQSSTGLFTFTDSVTNTQHAGVDEGGIVKVHGNHLVILRRGRLFTVAIGDQALTPVSKVDAFAPDMDPDGAWYDEMLVSDDTIAVIGYSYERSGTEVGLFNIDAQGQLSYRSTYHLRSNDYYSSRNYASRLIGNKLIFYTPLYFYPNFDPTDPFASFAAVRKWHKNATDSEFRRIVSVERIYHPEGAFDFDYSVALHTVTICDLANQGFDCQATTVIGPPSRSFYVSPDSVYVWASSWNFGEKRSPALLFRLPLDGSGPSALRVSGSPVDQFSFLQSEDQHLNVLVRSQARGDGMWKAEVAAGDIALMRVPIATFSDGSEMVPATSYQQLQKPEGYTFQNRFVGNYLIYGTGSGWGDPETLKQAKDLFLTEWARGNSHKLKLPHGVDRIEQMGRDAVVVGTDGTNLHFTGIRLSAHPEIASRYVRERASQGELRSHGFFFKPDGENSGTLGLPISVPGRAGYEHLFDSSAAILFLRNESLQLSPIGELGAQSEKAVDDKCRASCVDWYGNARPLFLGGRVFALLGYELVEGQVDNGRIHELRRINYLS
jgi:hypothetical protein